MAPWDLALDPLRDESCIVSSTAGVFVMNVLRGAGAGSASETGEQPSIEALRRHLSHS